MGHLGVAKQEVFLALAKRLDQNPVGAPLNETLMRILHLLYSETQAMIGAKFPQGFVKLEQLVEITGMGEEELRQHLEDMANKGLVMDIPRGDGVYYMLSPLVIGFFEYTFMRVTDKLPMKELAELFHAYFQDPVVAKEMFSSQTKLFQTWAYESLMPAEVETEVLSYEKASEMIRDAGGGALTMCYCRHKAQHLGTACNAPVEDVCTSLGNAAEWLIRRGFARRATVDELLRVLDKTEELGLVHLADNVQKKPAYICHCCGCCCEALRKTNEYGILAAHPSNFIPAINEELCTGCGSCAKRCHVRVLSVNEKVPGDKKSRKAVLNRERCLGCGACIRGCKEGAIKLVRRQEIYVPPLNKKEQMMRIALEKGKIPHKAAQ